MLMKMRWKWIFILIVTSFNFGAVFLEETVTEVVFTVSSSRGSTRSSTDSYSGFTDPLNSDESHQTISIPDPIAEEQIRKHFVGVVTTDHTVERQKINASGSPLPFKNSKLIRKRPRPKVNETKEILNVESSERESQVVFVNENAGYVPLPSRGRPGLTIGSSSSSIPTKVITDRIGVTTGAGIPSTGSSGPPDLTAAGLDWHHQTTAISEGWDREYRRFRFNNTRVQHIEAECQDDYMKIRIGFNGSFAGLLYSAGYAYDPDCMYINGTGRDYYEFYIQLNRCGTLGKNTHSENSRKAPSKNFMWNTVTVQYNPLIEEEFDEHFKVTCEYGYDFWKTVTFPFLDVEVATGNPVVFTLTPPECYMEIRYGYGTQGNRVAGPVRVGDPLTLIIYMRSKYDGFDIVVNDCYAHNGATKKIQLIDEFGCPVDDKLISRFRGSWSDSGVFETQVFAYMKTFRFTGSPALYIECDVRMCHGRCPSQPCHWRNSKQKRSINSTEDALSKPLQNSSSLSENVNLFQSLRVLQEGENDDSSPNPIIQQSAPDTNNNVCIKTGWFGAILTLMATIFFALSGILLTTCSRLKKQKSIGGRTDSTNFSGYMSHKGCIN